MNHLSVDGVEMSVPLSPETSFQELIRFLKEGLVAERALISSIKVNGTEITSNYEREINPTPISQISSIEIFTSHPKELVEETLQNLIEYSTILENLSRSSAIDLDKNPHFQANFIRLLEGITTFTEAIVGVKKILKVGLLQKINLLEVDLLSILKDLLDSQQNNQFEYTLSLLQEHLPNNLQQWREDGIPELIRLRDC